MPKTSVTDESQVSEVGTTSFPASQSKELHSLDVLPILPKQGKPGTVIETSVLGKVKLPRN